MIKISGMPLRLEAKAICPLLPPNWVGEGAGVRVFSGVKVGRENSRVLVGVPVVAWMVKSGVPVDGSCGEPEEVGRVEEGLKKVESGFQNTRSETTVAKTRMLRDPYNHHL